MKKYFSYQEIHRQIARVADDIMGSEFEPDAMVAIGGGGFIPARILRTYINKPIFTVGISYYDENDNRTSAPKKTQWIDHVDDKLAGKKILLVDEVDDTRATLAYCLTELLKHNPAEIRVFALHQKNKPKLAELPPEVKVVYVGEVLEDHWIVYPWDASDIDAHMALTTEK